MPLPPQSAEGHHFHDSLDLLFRLVNDGHGHEAASTDISLPSDGLVFEPLKADLFSPEHLQHIDSVRLSNEVLQKVLELLLLSRQPSGKNKQRGYVSYAQLGINQLGAVYEGLMAYSGFIADRDLIELAKDGDPSKGTWMVPVEDVGKYDSRHIVKRRDTNGVDHNVIHKTGTFVYRLAGRDRQRSASYYTPEVLTKCVVEHALAELITDDTAAAEILEYRVCEPALGSGAFANEAVNQLAAAYLERRQREIDETIDPTRYQEELQKVKAWIALHRVYGVDLNATAVELAEVSVWLNVMYPGLQAPWFGLHLRRGNSLIGARRATYDLKRRILLKDWHKTPPQDRPLSDASLGPDEVHHFLLPSAGWGAAGSAREARELAPDQAQSLRKWTKAMGSSLSADETRRLKGLAQRVERLWALAQRRLEISEHEVARTIDVWRHSDLPVAGAVSREQIEDGLFDPDSPYQRLRLAMDVWCALFYWPVTEGTASPPCRGEWLDTLEGLLGVQGGKNKRVGADQIGLQDLPADFHELGQIDDTEAALFLMQPTAELVAATPWLAHAREIAGREGFFHWELDFAQVFSRGGFDLQVGNPPWVRPVWQDDVTLAEFDPYFMLADKIPTKEFKRRRTEVLTDASYSQQYLSELSSHAGLTQTLGSSIDHEVLSGIQINLYMSFMERVWRSAHTVSGVAALLHPESHFNDPKGGALRRETYGRLRRHWQFINEGRLFEDVHHQTEYAIHVYGPPGRPRFRQMANLLYPDTIDLSLGQDGTGEPPGIKLPNGNWDLRPHSSRVVTIDQNVLAQWAALFDEPGTPSLEARLMRPIVREHLEAIAVLSRYPTRMTDTGYGWWSGWHERGAKEDGTIVWNTQTPEAWDEVILQGPHFFVSNPFFKQPNQPCTSNLDYTQWDLENLPEDAIPRTNYQRACDRSTYDRGIPDWFGKPANQHYRLIWRNMTQPSSQRTLISCIMPPGPGHVNTVHSLAFPDTAQLVAAAALWSSIALDFLLKVAGVTHVQAETVDRLPLLKGANPELALRSARLNCTSGAYTDLWADVWNNEFVNDSWSSSFVHLPKLNSVEPAWSSITPLRSDEARRAALVEIDALSALMLGLTADELVAVYTGQMAVLRKYEHEMWFDATGRVIAKDNAAKGARQQEQDFSNLQAYLAGEDPGDLFDRYAPPFRKPDREAEMRAAYAEFQERLGL